MSMLVHPATMSELHRYCRKWQTTSNVDNEANDILNMNKDNKSVNRSLCKSIKMEVGDHVFVTFNTWPNLGQTSWHLPSPQQFLPTGALFTLLVLKIPITILLEGDLGRNTA